jgi:hypothetical protein
MLDHCCLLCCHFLLLRLMPQCELSYTIIVALSLVGNLHIPTL